MYWQYNPYALVLLIAAAISVMLALYTWRRRPALGATPLTLLMVSVAEWSVGYALELGVPSMAAKVFWAKLEYLGIVMVPVTWLALTLQFTGQEKVLTRRRLALLVVVPLVTLLMAWTNELHGLVWSSIRLVSNGSFPTLFLGHGIWFWVNFAFSYVLLIAGTFLLLRALAYSPQLYHGQVATLLIGALAPWVGNVLYVSGLTPFLDLTPLCFTVTGLAMAWGLIHFRLLVIIPMACDVVVKNMSDAVIMMDTQNRIVGLNPTAETITGNTASTAIGQPVAQIVPALRALLADDDHATGGLSEITLGKEDVQRSFDLRHSPVYNRRGRLTGHLAVLRDITRRKQAEDALRRAREDLERRVEDRTAKLASANEALREEIDRRHRAEERTRKLNEELELRVKQRTMQLKAANKELEAFAYSVSHDLRAPLRSMNGFSEILLEDYSDSLDTEGRDYLRRVRAASQRMAALIDDLLTLSRITRREIHHETVVLSALAHRIAAELQETQVDRDVEFVIEDGVLAEGDAGLLQVVLQNLMGNSWKFTSKQPHPMIQLGVTENDGERAYFVRDNGAGFDMEYVDKLFGAFQRLHLDEDFAGTGIGLATVQRIIHRHGGRVWAEGEVGQGATFYFTLDTRGSLQSPHTD